MKEIITFTDKNIFKLSSYVAEFHQFLQKLCTHAFVTGNINIRSIIHKLQNSCNNFIVQFRASKDLNINITS